jgi:MFS family permease
MLAVLRQRNFALLWWGGLISMVGDWVLMIGLPLQVYRMTGSTLATGAMFMAGLLPSLLLGSVAGVFIDRWDRRRTMVIVNLLLALGLLPLLAVHSAAWLWVVYLVSFVEESLAQFVRPAEGALLPLLVDEEHLLTANSLGSLSSNVARLSGPLLGGVLVAWLGLSGVALVDAASFLIAAALIALIGVGSNPVGSVPSATPAAVAQRWTAVWQEWWAGLQLVRRLRVVATIFLALTITGVGEGIFSTLYAPFATRVLHGGGVLFGELNAAQAVGGVIGSLVIGRVSPYISPVRLLGCGAGIFGLIDLMIFDYPLFFPGAVIALVLMVAVGIPGVGALASMNTLLQTSVSDEFRGRIWGAIGTTGAAAQLVGTTLAGTLGDRVGIVPMLNVQGGGYVVAGVLVLVLLRRYQHRHVLPVAAENVPAAMA